MDLWAAGAAYDPYTGRWSRLTAREFLDWLGVPPGSRWLDAGCGTGALTQTILEVAAPRRVHGVDRSPGHLTYARHQTSDARADFSLGEAQALPFRPASFDATVSGLVLNSLPEPGRTVAEMARTAEPAGTVAAYVWDYADQMQVIRRFWDAAMALDPAARELDEGCRFPICRPGSPTELLRAAGLRRVEGRAIDVPARFRDFDDYWSPFLGGQGPAPAYAASLSRERRAALRERLREILPTAPDGSIHLTARAWAARGRAA